MMASSQSWPKGLSEEVAVIDIEVSELESLYGVSFERDLDDLDYFRYHIFVFGDKFYALMRYENAPLPGVTLVVEERDNQDLRRCVAEALQELRLTSRRVLWQRQ